MVNNKYRKGADYERYIVNLHRKKGLIALRSAGSKSKIDCVVINDKDREILLIQAKTGRKICGTNLKEIESLKKLNGSYNVKFELWEKGFKSI